MSLEDQLTRTISEQVTTVDASPRPISGAAVRRGRGIRRRRSLVTFALPVAAVAAVGAVVDRHGRMGAHSPDPGVPRPETFAPVGALDYSQGLRAFASPDEDGEVSHRREVLPRTGQGLPRHGRHGDAVRSGLLRPRRAGPPARPGRDRPDAGSRPRPERRGRPTCRPRRTRGCRWWRSPSRAPTASPCCSSTSTPAASSTVSTCRAPARAARTSASTASTADWSSCAPRQARSCGTREASGEARWTLLGTDAFRVADARNGRVSVVRRAPDSRARAARSRAGATPRARSTPSSRTTGATSSTGRRR